MSFSSLPLWRETLATALQKNASKRHSQYVQLATCDTAGVPVCRTLVFRGFTEDSDSLIMHTDLRSHKIPQIRANNRGEICWYFSDTREQFRMAGTLEIVTNENHALESIRRQHWQDLSDAARASYYQATPGSPISGAQDSDDKQIESEKMNDLPAKTFALLIFKPDSIDHLLLTTTPHERTLHQLNASNYWCCEKVNP
jgi:PPOX class probable FMN-dependent enzyme